MDRWVRHLAKQVAAGGLCLTVLAGMVHGLSPLELLLRGVVIGLVLYFAIVLVGGLIGQALLRLAVEEQMAAAQTRKALNRAAGRESESEDEGSEADADADTDEVERETGGDAGEADSGDAAA